VSARRGRLIEVQCGVAVLILGAVLLLPWLNSLEKEGATWAGTARQILSYGLLAAWGLALLAWLKDKLFGPAEPSPAPALEDPGSESPPQGPEADS